MKFRFISLFVLLISFNAKSYVPLFLAQQHLNVLPEKLMVKINSVTSEALPENDEEMFHFYRITLSAEVKFVGETNSELHAGNTINIFYKTLKMRHGLGPLCGYMPIKIPETQDLCIVYLENNTGTNYNVGTYWALQIVDTEAINDILADDHPNSKLYKTPRWVKEGVEQLQAISTTDNTNSINAYDNSCLFNYETSL